ncbi:MAG: cytochrome c [Ferruginibacter sp.]
MKRLTYITAIFITAIIVISACHSKRDPGRAYMPDMAYSRAYESYAERDSTVFTMDPLNKGGKTIYYDSRPVYGTIKRGEISYPYMLPNDTIGYKMSAAIKNPFDSISASDLAEAGRLFNINCAICHGEKGAANGPLATAGHIGGVANISSGEKAGLADGTMFHVMTYGKGNMGSYASQLSREQRWMIVKYIRTLQPKAAAAGAATATGTKAATDSTATRKG